MKNVSMKPKRDTMEVIKKCNYVVECGFPVYAHDVNKFAIGDGVTKARDLEFVDAPIIAKKVWSYP